MSEAEARSGSVATYEEYQANKRAGKVTVDKSINTKRLNRNQISAMYAVRGIARATGINIVLENKGLVRETNGAYDPNTNTIHIDINAGKYGLNFGEYAMLRTLSHELTHYIRENNKAAYKQLQDFIFSKLSDYKGKSIDELVAAEQYEGMEFEDAAEEVVARACEMMLRNSAAIEALYYENRGLFDTIKNFIANFKKAVYKAFDRIGARSEAAKAMLQYADELQALWDNALVGAVHNQQGNGNKADSKNIKTEKIFTEDENNGNQNTELLAGREVSAVGGSGNSVWTQSENSEKLARYLGQNSELERKIPPKCRAGESGWILRETEKTSGTPRYNSSLLRRISRLKPSGKDTIGRIINSKILTDFSNTVFKDENGNLLSLFHWTEKKFDVFAKGEFGFHFGTLEAAHDRYIETKEHEPNTSIGNYKEVYLNITNPIELTDDNGQWEAGWVALQLVDLGIINEHQYELLQSTTEFYEPTYDNPAAREVRNILESKDYDGIIYRNLNENVGSFSVIAFHPEQILTVAENGVLKENNGVTEGDDAVVRYERVEITEDEVISQSKKAMAAELTRLRELLKMQGRESHGTLFTKSSVDLVAAELIEKADSRLTKAELAPLLQKLYARIASDKELNFEDVMDEARGIADKINEDVRQRKFQDPYKKEIRDYLRKNRILIKDKKY